MAFYVVHGCQLEQCSHDTFRTAGVAVAGVIFVRVNIVV